MHTCNICLVQKSSMKSLVRHIQIHRSNASFQCTVQGCSRNFRRYNSLTCHLSRDHDNVNKSLKNENIDRGCFSELKCPLAYCQQTLKNPSSLRKHFKYHLDRGQHMQCPFTGCNNVSKSYGGFKSHNIKYHKNDNSQKLNESEEVALVDPSSQHLSEENSNFQASQIVDAHEVVNADEEEDIMTNQEYIQNLATFYLKLQSKYLIPASTVQVIVEEINNLNNLRKDFVKTKLFQKLKTTGLENSTIDDICNFLIDEDPLSAAQEKGPLRSIHSRKNIYKSSFNLIEPVKIILGRNRFNEMRSFFYIPILESLTILFNDKFVKENLQINLSPVKEPDLIADFNNGGSYQRNIFFQANPDAVKIILYQDSFDLVNPLGAAKSKYKILAVYMTVGNLPSYVRYKVDPMQLVLLCFEQDFKEFGMNKIFGNLISDLIKLENGVQLTSITDTVKGSLLYILGDNLGSHIIGGFSDNFSFSDYFCRYCLMRRKRLINRNSMKVEKRTAKNYSKALKYLAGHKSKSMRHGIKTDSPFNSLQYFHVCNPSLPPCLGHDLFEGIVQYDVPLILKKLVGLQWFSVESLNSAIKSFPFKDYDANDKPPLLKKGFKKLGGNAVQNWCFVRNLPFLIYNVIDESNEFWCMFLLLLEIVEFSCAPKLYERELDYFEDVIEEYLQKRKMLFPEIQLRPKHHYLSHYPWLYKQFGPLILVWTMRCESKHSYFKRSARYSSNFKNVLLSLSTKHQLLQAYLGTGILYGPYIEISNNVPFHRDTYSNDVQKAISDIGFDLTEDVHVSHSVKFKGMLYKTGSIIVIGIGKCVSGYKLGKVMFCLLKNSDVFIVSKMVKSYYDSSLRAFQIEEENLHVTCTAVNDLLDHQPLPVYVIQGYEYFKFKHAIATPLPV